MFLRSIGIIHGTLFTNDYTTNASAMRQFLSNVRLKVPRNKFSISLVVVFEINLEIQCKLFDYLPTVPFTCFKNHFSANAGTELWDLTDEDDPKQFLNPLQSPSPKSRDYQFGIALYEINSTTTASDGPLPNRCLPIQD